MRGPDGEETSAATSEEVYVEPRPSGGFAVKLLSSPAPVSCHDTEEEALVRAAAYRRGLERERR